MSAGEATVRVLGPVQVVLPDRVIEIPSASQRRLLAALAVHAPRAVRLDWLCWVLGVTSGAVRTTVARLRRAAGEELVVTTVTGYRLGVPVDAALACTELYQGSGDPGAVQRALARWVGPAYDEFRGESWAVGEAARLDEVYASAIEDRAESLIARGDADEAIAILEGHVGRHEFRDRPQGLVLRALAASGRRTEALRRYQAYRTFLADEVGTEPSDELQRIDRRVAAGWNGIEPDAEGPRQAVVPPRPDRVVSAALMATDRLVGRRNELAVLGEAASQTEQAGLQLVLVEGEAGIGKTSLVGSFVRDHCDPSQWHIVYSRCDEYIGEPFQPFRGLLSQLVDALPIDALAAHTASCGGDLSRLVPTLQDRVPAPVHEPGDDQATARHFLFQAAVDIVRRSTAPGPLLLVFDDLHWAEPTGLALLVHLVRELSDAPVLFIASYRDTGEDTSGGLRAACADLVRLGAHRIGLAGLNESDLADLVHARVAESTGLDVSGLAERLASETAGNPLFAEHLLRHWADSASMDFTSGALTLSGHSDGPSTTIRDLVLRRVGVLGPIGRDVLSAAAVLGTEFEEPVVAAMTGLDPFALDNVLDQAVRAGLVAAGSGGSKRSRFTHAVVAWSLEADSGDRARSRLHAAAFDALSSVLGVVPSRLAHHAERAGRIGDAHRWTTAAGEAAMANLAATEAVGWFRRSLAHADELSLPDEERAALLVRLGEAEYRAGLPEGLDTLHGAAALAQRCDADDVLVQAAMAIDPGSIIRFGRFAPQQLVIAEAAQARLAGRDVATRARVEGVLAQSLVHTDQVERRQAAAEEALRLARESGDPAVLVRVATDALMALWTPGNAAARCAIAEEAGANDELLTDPSLAATFAFGAFTAAVCAGDAAAAQRHAGRLATIAGEIDEPRARWTAAIVEAFNATMTCRFRDAERSLAAMLDIGTRIGEPETFAIFAGASFVLGTFEGRHAELLPLVEQVMDSQPSVDRSFRAAHALLCLEVGRVEPGETLLREAIERGLDTVPNDLVRSTTLLGYAVLALELGDAAAAGVLLPQIEPLGGEVSFNGVSSQGPIAAYIGKLMALLGRHDEAEHHLLVAVATAEAFGWEYHRASTLLALAQNRAKAGRFDAEADDWLAAAEAMCDTYGLSLWARRAATLRAEVATTRR